MKDFDDIKIEFGKVIGGLEATNNQLTELKNIVNIGFKTVIEECNKNINVHSATCTIADQLSMHLLKHEERNKYEKENEIKQDKIQTKKINWFKWVISIILSVLGIKGVCDIVFNSSHKIDKLIK